jgi:uncharacterized protein (UPF0548 family)
MLFFRKPRESSIRSLLAERGAMTYSYPQVGATRSAPPAGWRINHLRLKAGSGRAKFDALAEALFSWKLLAIDGLVVFPSAPALQPGTDVAILSRHFGIWSVDFCRVIYVLKDQQEETRSRPAHGVRLRHPTGPRRERRRVFSLEWHRATEEVWYDVYSFSLPATPLVRLLAPLARATQRRFARESLEKAARWAAQS